MESLLALSFDRPALHGLCRRYAIRRLAVFGSAIRGELERESDLDILVEFEPGTAVGLRFITLQAELSDLLGRRVDLVTAGFLSHTSGRGSFRRPFRSMKRPEDETLLRDMVDHARRAIAAVAGKERGDLDVDDVLAAALERFIEVVGEAASKISPAARESLPGVPWFEIIGMRNRLIHGYASVDHDIVWTVVTSDLPSLVREIGRVGA